VDREQKLGRMEVALANKTDENATLQTKVQELTSTLASKDQEMTAQATNFKVAEEKLIGEAATRFADGFAEALVQATCANPNIDVSGCSPLQRSGRWQACAFGGLRGTNFSLFQRKQLMCTWLPFV